nr:hypothetical protein B0A51_04926 [Rachicladosporium sp. CCFEE 5018]
MTAPQFEKDHHEWPIYFTAHRAPLSLQLPIISVTQEAPKLDLHLASFVACRSDDDHGYADDHLLRHCYLSTSERLDLAKSWLDECQAQHAECVAEKGTKLERPSRLLHIGQDLVRVVHNAATDAPYAALSYCWGRVPFLTLHKDSEPWLSHGFHPSELPETFRDAIKCATALGITYLWIDALCIRQDDAADTALEISKMGDIFYGSQITIEASTSSAAHEGFLETSTRPGPGVLVRWQQLPVPRYVRLSHHVSVWDDITDSAVHKRAWTLQERKSDLKQPQNR